MSGALDVTATCHVLDLDSGLFCVSLAEPLHGSPGNAYLPGVRVSLPPGPLGAADGVTISTFRPDGWLDAERPAALVHVPRGKARVLLTIYHQAQETAPSPKLVIAPLVHGGALTGGAPVEVAAAELVGGEIAAHVRNRGDVRARLTEWVGIPGSRLWLEGFRVTLPPDFAPSEVEYQAVLANQTVTPWTMGPAFCGSRGQTMPLLGLALRLKGPAAGRFDCHYRARFIDGSVVGPLRQGEMCAAQSMAALEAFQLILHRRTVAD